MRKSILFLLIAIIAVFGVTPLWAQSPQPTWQATYFNNIYFLNPPVLDRFEGRIAYNWGTSSPATGVQADNFSVRWGANVTLDPGTYRFYVMVDDEVKITLDNTTTIIDTFGKGQVSQLVTQDVGLNGGQHHIQIDYREFGGIASIFFSFEGLNDGVQGPDFNTTPATPQPVPPAIGESDWLAEYFNNQNLSGTPVVVTREADPTHDWKETSPFPGRLSDNNYSVRWTRNMALAGGVYHIRAVADDGVRVYVDNQIMIDQWHISTGETFTKDFSLSAGVHNVRVEYFEQGGGSLLQFSLTGNTPPPQPPAPTTPTATINTGRLNVRSQPNATSGVLTKVNFGATVNVVGITADNKWVQVSANGVTGWVNASFVILNNAAGVPIVGNSSSANPPSVTGYNVLADRFSVNIRSGAGTQFKVVGTLRLNQSAAVVGRNANNTWWQVNYNGVVGWVSAVYTRIDANANTAAIPVTG